VGKLENTVAIAQGMTLEDFLRLPDWKKPYLEYEEGTITQKVSPKAKHSRLQKALVLRFDTSGATGKVAEAFAELRFSFRGRSYIPDVSVYRHGRIPRDASGEIADDFFELPDIVVEMLSPKQRVTRVIRRCVW